MIKHLIVGTAKVLRHSAKLAKNSAFHFFEENVIQTEYIKRSEYDALKTLVLKMNDEIKLLKNKNIGS